MTLCLRSAALGKLDQHTRGGSGALAAAGAGALELSMWELTMRLRSESIITPSGTVAGEVSIEAGRIDGCTGLVPSTGRR